MAPALAIQKARGSSLRNLAKSEKLSPVKFLRWSRHGVVYGKLDDHELSWEYCAMCLLA